jgi:hypothetical protein
MILSCSASADEIGAIDLDKVRPRRARIEQQVAHQTAQSFQPMKNVGGNLAFDAFFRQDLRDHLDGAAHRCERVLDFVCEHGGQLSDAGQP